MGIHREPDIECYWRTLPSAKGPLYDVREHMGCTRFQQIKRNLTIVDRASQISPSDLWFAPIEPMIYHLRAVFMSSLLPGTSISIDEGMANCQGRSTDIFILPGKPIDQGFKIWLCAYHGYVYAFELHSKKYSFERSLEPKPRLTQSQFLETFQASNKDGKARPKTFLGGHRLVKTQVLIYRFAQGLPGGYSWLLLLDNLFVNQSLLALLRKNLGIGAMDITRKNARGIPWQLLEKRDTVKHTWGSITPMIVGEVLMALWQDNAPLVFMTTAHSLKNDDNLVVINRRRPAITTVNRSIIEPVFDNQPRKELAIPKAINDYNHGMNGGDVAN
jgi:Transposase IS4